MLTNQGMGGLYYATEGKVGLKAESGNVYLYVNMLHVIAPCSEIRDRPALMQTGKNCQRRQDDVTSICQESCLWSVPPLLSSLPRSKKKQKKKRKKQSSFYLNLTTPAELLPDMYFHSHKVSFCFLCLSNRFALNIIMSYEGIHSKVHCLNITFLLKLIVSRWAFALKPIVSIGVCLCTLAMEISNIPVFLLPLRGFPSPISLSVHFAQVLGQWSSVQAIFLTFVEYWMGLNIIPQPLHTVLAHGQGYIYQMPLV